MYEKLSQTALVLVSFVTMLSEGVLVVEKTDRGIISAVTVAKLTMTDSEGKNEHAYVIPMEAKVMLNDKEAKITDLQKGDAVTVTMGLEGEVVSVSAKRTKKADPSANKRSESVEAAPVSKDLILLWVDCTLSFVP